MDFLISITPVAFWLYMAIMVFRKWLKCMTPHWKRRDEILTSVCESLHPVPKKLTENSHEEYWSNHYKQRDLWDCPAVRDLIDMVDNCGLDKATVEAIVTETYARS